MKIDFRWPCLRAFSGKQKTIQLIQACAKRKRNINGGSCLRQKISFGRQTWNDDGMEGGNRSYAVVFWHQVREKPELWADKSNYCPILTLIMNILVYLT